MSALLRSRGLLASATGPMVPGRPQRERLDDEGHLLALLRSLHGLDVDRPRKAHRNVGQNRRTLVFGSHELHVVHSLRDEVPMHCISPSETLSLYRERGIAMRENNFTNYTL